MKQIFQTKMLHQNILKKAHDENYINMVQKSFPNEGIKFLDGDTIISPGSEDATIDAVGSVIKAIDGVEQKKFKNAFPDGELIDIFKKD